MVYNLVLVCNLECWCGIFYEIYIQKVEKAPGHKDTASVDLSVLLYFGFRALNRQSESQGVEVSMCQIVKESRKQRVRETGSQGMMK